MGPPAVPVTVDRVGQGTAVFWEAGRELWVCKSLALLSNLMQS